MLACVVEDVSGLEVVLVVGLGVAEEVGIVDGLVEVVLGVGCVVPRSSGVQSPSGSEQPSVKE